MTLRTPSPPYGVPQSPVKMTLAQGGVVLCWSVFTWVQALREKSRIFPLVEKLFIFIYFVWFVCLMNTCLLKPEFSSRGMRVNLLVRKE